MSIEKDGIFNRKQFEEDIIDIAYQKRIKPLDLKNEKVIKIIDLIENMLNTDPKLRPTFNEVFSQLKDLKGNDDVVPCLIPQAVENGLKKKLYPDREYVVDEKQVMGKLEEFFKENK